jgi:hypothetical protein
MTLLEEYIRLALTEKIRRRRDPKTGKPLTAFDWDAFKRLKTPIARVLYARKLLQPFGSGSSRAVFLISSRKVLKIAKNEAGVEQNRTEVSIARDPDVTPVVTHVFDRDKKFQWIVSELVREIKDPAEFQKLTGTPWELFVDILTPEEVEGDDVDTLVNDDARTEVIASNPIILAAMELAANYELALSDLVDLEHWGKTADGRAVMLDYGYTVDIADKFYQKIG